MGQQYKFLHQSTAFTLYFWIDYITAKTKNQLFRQNPAQTQGSVTISNEKKTYNTIQYNIPYLTKVT